MGLYERSCETYGDQVVKCLCIINGLVAIGRPEYIEEFAWLAYVRARFAAGYAISYMTSNAYDYPDWQEPHR